MYGVLLALPKELVMYGLRCSNIEGWVERHKDGGRSLCYLFQPVCIQRSWLRLYNGIQRPFHRTNSLLQEQGPATSYTNLCLRPKPTDRWHWWIMHSRGLTLKLQSGCNLILTSLILRESCANVNNFSCSIPVAMSNACIVVSSHFFPFPQFWNCQNGRTKKFALCCTDYI